MAQYTLVANTWKHVEVVIPGNSDLVFNDDNGEGLQVRWMLSTGDDRDGATADTWFNPGSDFFQSTSSQVNFFDSTDNNFFLNVPAIGFVIILFFFLSINVSGEQLTIE